MAIIAAATAHAAYYKTLYCAAANGSGNPTLGARPGFFNFPEFCGTAYSDPPGDGGWLRLEENTTGTAGYTDEASYSWWPPPGTSIAAVSAYTRVPGYFNSGWRSRFWGEGFDGSENNILMQGSGVANDGIYAPATSNFVFHAWPFGSLGDYKRLSFALTCYRPAGCSREGSNATDANGIAITLNDKETPHVNWEGASPLLLGDWVRGDNPVAWRESDVGSGLRFSRLGVDGAVLGDGTIDYQANGGCRTGYSNSNGEFANNFQPCTGGPYLRYYGLETKGFSDGQHQMSICIQDYSQYVHVAGSASETCDRRTIHTDNSAPAQPVGLEVRSANPARYLQHFSAKFALPPNSGSPIIKVHYDMVDATGKVVMPEKTLSGTNPTELPDIEGPAKPGAYRVRVWLEDQVGLVGPAALAPIPHDTTPPAAPQELSVASPTTPRSIEGFDVRWHNLTDAGSPITAGHYEIRNAAGAVVVPPTEITGQALQGIESLRTARDRGEDTLRVWLSDEEGNVGAPTSAPLSYDCVQSEAPGGLKLSAGLGENELPEQVAAQGEGTTLRGSLLGVGGGIADARLCVFAKLITHPGREFLGLALTSSDGTYRFPVSPGASRELSVAYRSSHRQISAQAIARTRVRPTFKLLNKVVHNGHLARFAGELPGPDNKDVVVVLQVKSGKGWRVFRRYHTRGDGRYVMRYRLTHTTTPTEYIMRAQVPAQSGYDYEEGYSQTRRLRVIP